MPSNVIRRSRRHGLMKNHHTTTGSAIHNTTAFAISGTFMYIGGSLGPDGTRSKYGPVIHRIHT
ncbi:hypothetical protein MINTM005_01370 [Mycobacterium intracellulare]|uniref:Uncharacterized protein n=1 Tax=Mycobacterium paraintracellulare TaxID=1138383 RepID=A0ABM7K750_9MYCO|nr:hypothetical protein MPRI_20020 [Mycobacterium paraintracellulare]BCO54893.1 hypothetical protein MINTM005_01370 [Mycobacterium intracellulare]